MSPVRPDSVLTGPVFSLVRGTRRDRWWFWLALTVAGSAHGALGWTALGRFVPTQAPDTEITTELIDIDLPIPEKAEVPPEPEPEPEPKPEAKPRSGQRARTPPAAIKPSELATAAAVVTRLDDPADPVDMTGFVVGTATAYAGGTTASSGTSTNAVRSQTGINGDGNGQSAPSNEPVVDRTRPPGVVGDTEWNCPFPREADEARIRSATAVIRVAVDATDQVVRVEVIRDPSHGFGEAARRCAMSKTWRAARNAAGQPVAGTVTVRVRFIR